MNKPKDGGPAFPRAYVVMASGENVTLNAHSPEDLPPGMSLRDWLAGMAMQGLLANPVVMSATTKALGPDPKEVTEALADGAYEHADAMLTQRDKE